MPRMGENQKSEGGKMRGAVGARGVDVSVPPAFRVAEKGFKAPVT